MPADARKRVLVLLPTEWDRRQLPACRASWEGDYEVVLAAPSDEDCPADFDPEAFLERMVAEHGGRIDGVMSSSDYPGATLAAALATRLDLPGPRPEAVIGASHKVAAREALRVAVPEATPWFALVDPRDSATWEGLEYPCFVKPVKGAFSVLAQRIDRPEQLAELFALPSVREFLDGYLDLFNRMVSFLVEPGSAAACGGSFFIAEELLVGDQVTVEGYVQRGAVEILGVVDSVLRPGTGSFVRFDFPSRLPRAVREQMKDLAGRAALALGLESTLFNVELIRHPESGRIAILEVNPRMCGQFADLYEKLDGRNGYRVALDVATGRRPPGRSPRRPDRVAASFPLRAFERVRVAAGPDEAARRAAEALYPGTLVWLECAAGEALDRFPGLEDGWSHRYAVVNLGAPHRRALDRRLAEVEGTLGYRFEPL